jgi:prepilin-type processing-associated H-X9-DG protein
MTIANRLTHAAISTMNCPTRRSAILFPKPMGGTWVANNASNNSANDNVANRSDYAACGGHKNYYCYYGLDISALRDPRAFSFISGTAIPMLTGVSIYYSEIKIKDIPDGTSHTIYAGEKYLNPDNYFTGNDYSDGESFFHGYNDDITKFTGAFVATQPNGKVQCDIPNCHPFRDRRGSAIFDSFGSAHPETCNFVMCDGSVTAISFDIEGDVYIPMGGRSTKLEQADP